MSAEMAFLFNQSRMCRTCLAENETLFVMFDRSIANYPEAVDFLQNFCKIAISDNLPPKFCGICVEEITRAYAFKRKCEVTASKLKYLEEQTRRETVLQSPQFIPTYCIDDDDDDVNTIENPITSNLPVSSLAQKRMNINSRLESALTAKRWKNREKSRTTEINGDLPATVTYLDNNKKIKRVRICSDVSAINLQVSSVEQSIVNIASINQQSGNANIRIEETTPTSNIRPEISQNYSIYQSLENIASVNRKSASANIRTSETTPTSSIRPAISQDCSINQSMKNISSINGQSAIANLRIEETTPTSSNIRPELSKNYSINQSMKNIASVSRQSENANIHIKETTTIENIRPEISQDCSINQSVEDIDSVNRQSENSSSHIGNEVINYETDSPVSVILMMNDDEYLSDYIDAESLQPISVPKKPDSDNIRSADKVVIDTPASKSGLVISQIRSIENIDSDHQQSDTDSALSSSIEEDIVTDATARDIRPVITENCSIIDNIDSDNQQSKKADSRVGEEVVTASHASDVGPIISQIFPINQSVETSDSVNTNDVPLVDDHSNFPPAPGLIISQICSINQSIENIDSINQQSDIENRESLNGQDLAPDLSVRDINPVISRISSINQSLQNIESVNRPPENTDSRVEEELVELPASIDNGHVISPQNRIINRSIENIDSENTVPVEVEFINFPPIIDTVPIISQICSNQSIESIDSVEKQPESAVAVEEELVSFSPVSEAAVNDDEYVSENVQSSDEVIETTELLHNGVVSSEDSYICHLCANVILGDQNFVDHIAKHKFGFKPHLNHSPVESDVSNKTKQIEKVKTIDALEETLPKEVPIEDSEVTVANSFVCNKCGDVFNDKNSFTEHVQSHTSTNETNTSQEDIGETNKTRVLNVRRRYINNNNHSCDVCNNEFSTFEELIKHQRVHCSGERSKETNTDQIIDVTGDEDTCNDEVSSSTSNCSDNNGKKSKKDKQKKHSQYKPNKVNGDVTKAYVCGYCPKLFIKKFLLRTHLAKCRFSKSQYNCGMCGMSFETDDALNIHIQIHDDD